MRNTAYAARMLNAIAPTDAQTNIAKFNKSAIPAASGWIARAAALNVSRSTWQSSMRLSQKMRRVDPDFYCQIEYPQRIVLR